MGRASKPYPIGAVIDNDLPVTHPVRDIDDPDSNWYRRIRVVNRLVHVSTIWTSYTNVIKSQL